LYAVDPVLLMIRSITRYGLYVSGSKAPVPWFSSVIDIVALLNVGWTEVLSREAYSAPFITKSLRLLPLPVEAALPPKAMEIAVRIADLPPIISAAE
jgi:hypothetical protein